MTDGYRSSEKSAAWVRWVMPSAADLIFVALLGVLVFTPLAVKLLGDAGIGWHIRTGQLILATHAVPRVDTFSATVHGQPWFAWEWMYDLVVGKLEAALGLNGVVWFTAVVIAAVFAGLFRFLIGRGTNFVVALGLTLLATAAAMIHFLARPHVVSWLFALAWFWILDSAERGDGLRRLWILPGMMVVWVNIHGGFLVGFVLLGIFWIAAWWEWWSTKTNRLEDVLRRIAAARRVRELTWVGLASSAASVVNPYGWKLHEHIWSYLTNRFLMDHIEEFQSPNFHGVVAKCFGILILIGIVALAWRVPIQRRQKHAAGIPTLSQKARKDGAPSVSEILTVLFAVYAGLYAARNIPVSGILLAMVVGPWLSDVAVARGFSERMSAVESGLRGHAWIVAAVGVTFLIAVNGGRVGANQLIDAHFDAARMPVGAVDFLEQQKVGEIFSPDYWGGYLIYRMNRGVGSEPRVVVDDRHDLYGEEFLKQYLKMWHVEEGWKSGLMGNSKFIYMVLPRDTAATSAVSEYWLWKEVYRDDTAVVFEKRTEVNQ
jgi:hypothetical protein